MNSIDANAASRLDNVKIDIESIDATATRRLDSVKIDIESIDANATRRLDNVKIELKKDISKLRVDNEKLRAEMHGSMAQVQTSLNAQTWRIIGAISSLVVAVYFIVRAGH